MGVVFAAGGGAVNTIVCHCDDGSTLFEWIDKKRRFGISIEQNPEESCWWFVSLDENPEGGELPKELLDLLRQDKRITSASQQDPLSMTMEGA